MSKYFTKSEVECRCGECGKTPSPEMLQVADTIREAWGSPLICTSGARCNAYTTYLRMMGVAAARKSAHIEGLAMDLRPIYGKLEDFQNFVIQNAETFGVWVEEPTATPSWCHIQIRPVGKKRVFAP